MQKNPFNQKKPFYRAFLDFFSKSAVLSWLYAFTKALYGKIANSLIGGFFTSYEKVTAWLSKSRIAQAFSPKTKPEPRATLSFKIAKLYETSIFSLVIDKVKWALLTCQLNVLALFGITFGFSSALMLILKNFAFQLTTVSASQIISLINPLMTSLCFIIISILLIFSRKPLIRVVNESRLLGYILFTILRIRRIPSYEYEAHSGLNVGVSALLGIITGAVSYWFEPSEIAAALGIALILILIFHSPESGVAGMFFLLPFLPTMALVVMVCATSFSFAIKCMQRKRILKIGAIDILVAIFALFIFSGGVISVNIPSSIPKMLVFLCFISMYFVIKNIVRSENMLSSCAKSLSASAIGVALIGILQYIMGDVSQTWQDTVMFGSIPGRAVSTFENPNVLGEYLILVLPVIFVMLISAQKSSDKIIFFTSFILCSCCLIFTWSRGAWLGFAFAVIIFILLKSHEFLACIILLSPAILFGISLVISPNIMERLLSIGNTADSSTLYRINIWRGVIDMLSDTFLYGIGIGTEAFAEVFPMYALSGTEVAPHTHSLYLQIVSEMGIFALIAFLAIILAFVSIVFSYIRNTTHRQSRTVSIGCLCGICAFLVQGFTDYVWYNYRIYLFFWMMLGFSIAIICISSENERRMFVYA